MGSSRAICRVITVAIVIVMMCGCDEWSQQQAMSGVIDGEGNYIPGAISSIATLKALYKGSSHVIPQTITLEAIVTATDVMGEYPNAMIVQDDTGAIELSVYTNQATLYEIGDHITINCAGLWIGSNGGNLVIGTEPEQAAEKPVGYLFEEALKSRITLLQSGQWRTPQTVTASDFKESLKGCYIVMHGVEFVNGQATERYCNIDTETGAVSAKTHAMRDQNGDIFTLYVPATVTYAQDVIPAGKGEIYCTLDSYYSSYSVRMVTYFCRF